ncbi:Calcium-dependent protein kinase 4 [Mortierella polycephala]|uniref:Calcium-dependent protein kinase 4 n=1 Tax=Mortierella polycephala TaxID=41804 RepID=A0A9P6QBV5_9FUNG|nr:Calcium-dependent protein kinase 4 [Mortierella polycephala]
MSSPLLIAPLKKEAAITNVSVTCKSYVYTAPCEHHPSKGQTDYLVNDMFPKLTHDLSTIEFGIRIADFMPLAFKTVSVAGLAEKELQLLNGLGDLPNVIQLQDSFVNDNGDTVLVLPMLKKFDCHAVNKTLCSVRQTIRQVLTGLAAVHAKNIVHLDINPSNFMVTHDKKDVVIIDFGLSMIVDRSCKDAKPQVPGCGTIGYIAPEVMNPAFYQPCDPTLADLYSLGIVLGQMLEPYIPDCDLHYFGSKYLAVENTSQTVAYLKDFVAQGHNYPRVLIQAADLLRCMLEEDPKDRKSAQELLDTHPFFAPCPELTGMAASTLKLCDWLCRVQEIKYQRYLLQDQRGCEIYRYR